MDHRPLFQNSYFLAIVEDDHLVRMDTVSFLEGEGFVVHEADNAAAAIRSLELHDEIRLVFTDVNMPGWMNGLALAYYIRGRWPPVKIIVTSGYVNATQRPTYGGSIH